MKKVKLLKVKSVRSAQLRSTVCDHDLGTPPTRQNECLLEPREAIGKERDDATLTR